MSNGQSLKIILFLFVLSFLNYGSSSDLTHISHFCSNTTVFTINSTYQVNLNTLLSSLASRGPDNNKFSIGFYNDTAGQGPDKVYGLYQCRGDVSSTTCEDCVNFATRDVTQRCPVEKGAVIWYDQCLLRYSNGSISSVMVERPRVAMYNTQNGTDPDRFNSEVGRVMNEVVTQAVSSPKKFGTRANNVTVVFQPLSGVVNFRMYGLAQCTLDLPTRDCNICLRRALALIPSCCDFRIGGRILTPSCNIRYEIYSFYNETLPSPPPIGSPPRKGTKTTRIAIWVSASASVLVVLCGLFLWRMLRKDKTEKKPYNQEVQLFHHGEDQIPNHYSLLGEHKGESQDFPLLPLSLVLEATQHFSQENKLGEGGFGPVYKGVLSHGEEFAVKRFSRASAQGLQEFKNEVTLIAKLQHKNLVRLLGCCFEEEELILIYEYMPNKSLDFFIFDPTLSAQLDWTRRTNIISGIARGILYLHEDSRLRIIHRDLKASNVLLDQDMNAKISDFGMARIFGGNQNEANTNRIVGTYGYMAPEYAMEGLFSIKSDVFSFGVLLLEIISGRKNNKFHHSEQGQSLLTYTWKLWCEGQAMKVMDPVLAQSCPHSEALKCIHIGLLCVQEDPADRPTMSSVVLMLGSDTVMLPQPSEPAFSVGRVVVKATEFSSNVKICSANQVTVSTLSPR